MSDSIIQDRRYVPEPGPTEEAFDPSSVDIFGADVLLRREMPEELTEGGLHKPPSALDRELKHTATVVAMGPDASNFISVPEGSPPLSIGDRILFAKYHGVELKMNGEHFMLVRADDIRMRLHGEDIESDRID